MSETIGEYLWRGLPMPGQLWGHYKGGLYEIITLATHTENTEAMVIYRKVTTEPHQTWCRPLKVWSEKVGDVPRFAFTGKTKVYASLKEQEQK